MRSPCPKITPWDWGADGILVIYALWPGVAADLEANQTQQSEASGRYLMACDA
jgi:hypothetical protein